MCQNFDFSKAGISWEDTFVVNVKKCKSLMELKGGLQEFSNVWVALDLLLSEVESWILNDKIDKRDIVILYLQFSLQGLKACSSTERAGRSISKMCQVGPLCLYLR